MTKYLINCRSRIDNFKFPQYFVNLFGNVQKPYEITQYLQDE